ncbi:MAG: hypothetical protein K6B38_08305 [Ruminococcus sp.]|nr:hypothetical protein [Ruminococcus sp.]
MNENRVIVTEQPGKMSRIKANQIARLIQAYYSVPENLRRFEEWKAAREEKGAEVCCKQ